MTEVTKKKIASGNLTEKDKEKIKEARQYWKDNYAKSVKITSLSDADARLTCQIIKKDIVCKLYVSLFGIFAGQFIERMPYIIAIHIPSIF